CGGGAVAVWVFAWMVLDRALCRRSVRWRSGRCLGVRVDGGRSGTVSAVCAVAERSLSGCSRGWWSIGHCVGGLCGGRAVAVWVFAWMVVDRALCRRSVRWQGGRCLGVRVDGGRSGTVSAVCAVAERSLSGCSRGWWSIGHCVGGLCGGRAAAVWVFTWMVVDRALCRRSVRWQ